jgi:hypothetical protein
MNRHGGADLGDRSDRRSIEVRPGDVEEEIEEGVNASLRERRGPAGAYALEELNRLPGA